MKLKKKKIYKIKVLKSFKKALKKYKKSGKFDEKNLNSIIDLLVNDIKIPLKFKDHLLTGNFKNFRELHIEPDLLLIYKKDKGGLILILVDIGSHSELF